VCDGVTFFLKYLGSVLVERSSGEEVTAEAIKSIISMVGINIHKGRSAPKSVEIKSAEKGIRTQRQFFRQ
jgi:hypothetical protein